MPTRFDSEPAVRPSYIPQGQTLSSGRYAPVYFEPQHKSYGYWGDDGRFMSFGSIPNQNRGYQNTSYSPTVSSTSGPSAGSVLLVLGVIVFVVVVGVGIALYLSQSRAVSAYSPTYASHVGSTYTPRYTAPAPQPIPAAPKKPATTIDTWANLPPGSFVTLSDAQSLEDSQNRGDGLNGIDYTVESVARLEDTEGFGTLVLARLNDGHQPLLLVVKGVDANVDHRVYYASEDFHPDRRENVVNRGDLWLFAQPEDETNVKPAQLRYTAEITQEINGQSITYVRKDQGERQAIYTENPAPSGLGEMIATVVEYSTADPTDNPELLILEVGAASRKTGEVTLYLGTSLRPSEINIVKTA